MKLERLLNGRWVKHPYPILDLGQPGVWDDLMVDCPFVFSQAPGQYILFYTGHSSKSRSWGIGMAESEDLIQWRKYKVNPVLPVGGKETRMDAVAVLRNQDSYYLFFEAVYGFSRFRPLVRCAGKAKKVLGGLIGKPYSQAVAHASGRAIGIMTSVDMLHWSYCSKNPVLEPGKKGGWDSCGIFSPCLFTKENSFFMFYSGSDGKKIRTGVAFSKDLYHWDRMREPVLEPGSRHGDWDEKSVIIVTIIKLEDAYVAFYEGQDKDNHYAIGLAFSKDCRRWEKYENNPILTKGEKGAPDERIVNSPHAFIKEDEIFLFYGAQDFRMRSRAMLARFQPRGGV